MNAQAKGVYKVAGIAVLVLNTYQPKTRQDIVNSIVWVVSLRNYSAKVLKTRIMSPLEIKGLIETQFNLGKL